MLYCYLQFTKAAALHNNKDCDIKRYCGHQILKHDCQVYRHSNSIRMQFNAV